MKFATKIWHFYKSVFSTLEPMSLKTILYSHCDSKRSGAVNIDRPTWRQYYKRLRAFLVKCTETWPMFSSSPNLEACSDTSAAARARNAPLVRDRSEQVH